MTIDEARSSDTFFYYDAIDESVCMEADLLQMLAQPRRRLFYNRSYGCGLQEYENMPNALVQAVLLRYSVIEAFSLRNQRVAAGEEGRPDRRALTSQSAVDVEQDGGEMNVVVQYLPYSGPAALRSLSVPWGA